MIKKFPINSKFIIRREGSTLTLILITIAILTMLGTALLSMSLMNVNMKANDARIKRTLYYAESGIDQVYARVGKVVETAINTATYETDLKMQTLLSNLNSIVTSADPVSALMAFPGYDVYFTSEWQLIPEVLELKAEETYKNEFKLAMNTLDVHGILTAESFQYLDSNDPSNNSTYTITIDPLKISGFNMIDATTADPNDHVYVIEDVTSNFVLADHTEKEIMTDIVINDAVSDYPMSTIEQRITLQDNPLWQYPLVAHGDVSVSSDTVIDGDVYAYGLLPVDTALASPEAFGGLKLSGGADLTVNGNIFSRAYVQLTNNSSGRMTVNNGRLYANSLVIQRNATGDIIVNGNVYTADDLEMNGDGGSSITIHGSYYGYTDGSDPGSTLTHDKSSAIVLNSDMAAANLTIDGVAPASIDHPESQHGILIGGTAYVDVSPRYQTAESVSIKGNFVAYTWAFDTSALQTLLDNNTFSATPYNFFTPATHDSHVDDILNKDHVLWQQITGTSAQFANGYNTGSGDSEYTIKDRMAYFAAFSELVDGGTGTFIRTGGPGNITLNNYIYTTGLHLNTNTDQYVYSTGGVLDYENLRLKITKDYLYQLHKMAYRNTIDYDYANPDPAIIEKVGNGDIPTVENINVVEKYSDVDQGLIPFTLNESSGGLTTIKHYSDSLTPLTIHAGIAGTDDANNLYISSSARGIILRRGDINIVGALDFEGAIISSGNVTISSGSVSIRNKSDATKAMLAKMIYEHDTLYDLFKVSHYYGIGSADVNLDNVTYVSVQAPSGSTFDPNSNNVFTYSDWIHFSHWRVTR